jgi:cell shape-determining protein MreC
MSPGRWRPSKPYVFAILMVASAIVALLPVSWTGCADGVVQPLGWVVWTFSKGTNEARDALGKATSPDHTPEEYRNLLREKEELTRKLVHQEVEIVELERQVADLSGLRDQLTDRRAKIIFASVVGGDTSPKRETLTISKGHRQGVKLDDWVAAGVSPDERDPEATGRDLLLRQWLIGRVSEVYPYLSRVQLMTDPHFGPQRVQAARLGEDGSLQLAKTQCGLVGLGEGRMRIDRASEDYFASGYTIVVAPLALPRPIALVVGRIVASETLETGLHYNLEVQPWGTARTLSQVYVISFSQ